MKIFETWNDFSKDQKRVWKRKVSSQLLLQEELFHTFFQLYQGTQSRATGLCWQGWGTFSRSVRQRQGGPGMLHWALNLFKWTCKVISVILLLPCAAPGFEKSSFSAQYSRLKAMSHNLRPENRNPCSDLFRIGTIYIWAKSIFGDLKKTRWSTLSEVCIKSFEIFLSKYGSSKRSMLVSILYESEAPLIVFAADRLKWISEVKIINHHHHNNSHLPWALLVQYVLQS